ncbi:MAG: DUF1559 domain-containing protein, partial [Pirellulales bacterium]
MVQANRSVPRRGGVTWLEVLAACAVAALVVQLLLPALQVAREAARRRQCAANLRQLGQALHQYSDAHGQLPPAAFWDGSQLDLVEFPRIDDTVPVTAANWVELLLPYLENDAQEAGFDPAVPAIAPARAAMRQRNLPWMRCPSDSYAVADNPYVYENPSGAKAYFARGNYAINGGVQNIYEAPGTLMGPRPLGTGYSVDMERRRCQWWGSGVAGFNKSFRLRSITNGLATTVLLDEVRAGIHPMDPRGVWALG